ncbi:MAG: 50S ribosome-binding GTPase, partial [Eubacteriales bacterium]|nr:50S ribosome-binding GTPase [Eubacteriales bacterium]
FINGVKKSMESEINREKSKGRIFRPIRIMAAGIPNVGKSSFINRIAGKSGAITGDKPGVTKGRQWIKINPFIELLDTPGILQPRYDSRETGLLLAYTGAIKDDIFDKTEVASLMMSVIAVKYPGMISGRYGIKAETVTEPLKLLEEAAIKRGCLMHGGETDLERMASLVLDEFRAGKIGRITLEEPENHQ